MTVKQLIEELSKHNSNKEVAFDVVKSESVEIINDVFEMDGIIFLTGFRSNIK